MYTCGKKWEDMGLTYLINSMIGSYNENSENKKNQSCFEEQGEGYQNQIFVTTRIRAQI